MGLCCANQSWTGNPRLPWHIPRETCGLSVFNHPLEGLPVCLPIPPTTLPCPEISSPRGWVAGGTGDKHLVQETPAPAPARARARARATCGLARFCLCPLAWEPGSPRSHAKNPGLAPSSPGFCTVPPALILTPSVQTVPASSCRALSAPAPPGSMGICSKAGCGGGRWCTCHVGTGAERPPAHLGRYLGRYSPCR